MTPKRSRNKRRRLHGDRDGTYRVPPHVQAWAIARAAPLRGLVAEHEGLPAPPELASAIQKTRQAIRFLDEVANGRRPFVPSTGVQGAVLLEEASDAWARWAGALEEGKVA